MIILYATSIYCVDWYTLEFLMLKLRHITIDRLASYARFFFFIEGDVLYFCRLYLMFGLALLSEALTSLCAMM
jgi:hypothetical protein